MSEVVIDTIGSLGHGMARLNGKSVFVPHTLLGEKVRISGDPPHCQLEEVLVASNDRIDPSCQHFGTCGGCDMQHMASAPYLEWKRDEVAFAFKKAGIEAQVDDCISCDDHSRRRVTFTSQRGQNGIEMGFHQRASEEIVDIQQCPILLPVIETAMPVFRGLIATLLRGNETIQLAVTACDNGLDLFFTLEQDPTEDMMAAFVRALAKTNILRASINDATVVEVEKPFITFGDTKVAFSVGSFSQAVQSSEIKMAEIVCSHLKSRKRVLDLFSGVGTFSLRLARNSQVHAVEMDSKALTSLLSASSGLKSVTTETRDLHELPLTVAEMKKFDGVCLDPPRAGAEAQIKEIAKSSIREIAYVSCNPTSLVRDAAALIKAGFTLKKVTPIDQFLYSNHVEVVALFSKKPAKGSRSIFNNLG